MQSSPLSASVVHHRWASVEAATLRQYYELKSRLPVLGFVREANSDVICRWRQAASGVLFDLMPIDPAILGFSNRWYPEAARPV